MAAAKKATHGSRKAGGRFTQEELAAMREAVRERSRPRRGGADGEHDVLEKISQMQGSDRVLAERIHALVKANAPSLSPRTWYGMPAYSRDDHVVCFFRCAAKFKTRYATLGFSDEAKLDQGQMWATDFAVTEITPLEEEQIVRLLRKAVG